MKQKYCILRGGKHTFEFRCEMHHYIVILEDQMPDRKIGAIFRCEMHHWILETEEFGGKTVLRLGWQYPFPKIIIHYTRIIWIQLKFKNSEAELKAVYSQKLLLIDWITTYWKIYFK